MHLLQPQQRRLRRPPHPVLPHQNPTVLLRFLQSSTVNSYFEIFSASTRPNEIQSSLGVPIIIESSFTSFCFFFTFNSSTSRCLSFLMSPSFSRSATHNLCFGVRYQIGVGAFRHKSTILLMHFAIALPPPPEGFGLASLFLILDLFITWPALSLALPLGFCSSSIFAGIGGSTIEEIEPDRLIPLYIIQYSIAVLRDGVIWSIAASRYDGEAVVGLRKL
ncbi:hypothetical protein Sjap_013930 [Stephania japonica]|uniref:Uncharacterized protein n=1 Tax=Stephania japonica TaxID=461633 RepID=A0AAP0NZ28_9MAGN